MKSNSTIVAAVFVLLLIFLANPFYWWMPTELQYVTVAAVAVVAAVFAGLVKGESARDEREVELRAHAARAGYLSGIFVLTLATAVSVLSGEQANSWILGALGVMVLVRLVVRTKSE